MQNRQPKCSSYAYGKQSIAVDLKRREGIEIVKKLAGDAHVLIEPFRTGLCPDSSALGVFSLLTACCF